MDSCMDRGYKEDKMNTHCSRHCTAPATLFMGVLVGIKVGMEVDVRTEIGLRLVVVSSFVH